MQILPIQAFIHVHRQVVAKQTSKFMFFCMVSPFYVCIYDKMVDATDGTIFHLQNAKQIIYQ